MLSLWEKHTAEVDTRHFAFRCEVDDVLNKSVSFLKLRNLIPYNFLKDGTERPMVFACMPAIAIYVNDPNGHAPRSMATPDKKPGPELRVISYEDWLQVEK